MIYELFDWIKKILKQLFCKHDFEQTLNLIVCPIIECKKCGRVKQGWKE